MFSGREIRNGRIVLDANLGLEWRVDIEDEQTTSATGASTERASASSTRGQQVPGPANTSSSGSPASGQIFGEGASARDIVRCLLPHVELPDNLSEQDLYRIIRKIVYSERPRRTKLLQYNTFDDAVELFKKSSRILILTGAGVSVSCGIPDFRSKNGIYARLHAEYPDLPDPTAMFDINYFSKNPKPFFEFAKELFPGRYKASRCHYFIKAVEDSGKLLRNYTQNIDTLEQVAGIKRILQCHGSFATATCRNCGLKVDSEVIREDINAGRVAMCRACNQPEGILKPDIVFFGEDLSDEFHEKMAEDKDRTDLVVVIGSSLKVQPVAHLPHIVEPAVPQILINRESLPHYATDIELLGNCDDIVTQIALALGPPFTEIFNKECSIVNSNDSAASEPISEQLIIRQVMDETQFKKLLDQPAAKRPRIKEELPSPSMWDARFVNVGSNLPDNYYLFVAPNKNIFPGAEFFYDKDDDTFRQLTNRFDSSPISSIAESGDSEAGQEETNCRLGIRTMSLEEPFFTNPAVKEEKQRSHSCPPNLDCEMKYGIESSFTKKIGVGPLQTVTGDATEKNMHRMVRASSCDQLDL